LFFRTVPSANTLVRWVNENAFASIVQARPCPTFGRPVHLRGSPHRLRPGTSPHAFQIPSRDGLPALRRIAPPADDALPPSLDMTPLIRAPEGLKPSRTTRCSARTMASADFWQSFPTPLDVSSTQADRQIPPGMTHSPSRLCLSDLRRSVPCKNWALPLFAGLPHCTASIRFLFVRPAFCLQLPPDSTSRWTPLPFS
jgi:hypothetical protein